MSKYQEALNFICSYCKDNNDCDNRKGKGCLVRNTLQQAIDRNELLEKALDIAIGRLVYIYQNECCDYSMKEDYNFPEFNDKDKQELLEDAKRRLENGKEKTSGSTR